MRKTIKSFLKRIFVLLERIFYKVSLCKYPILRLKHLLGVYQHYSFDMDDILLHSYEHCKKSKWRARESKRKIALAMRFQVAVNEKFRAYKVLNKNRNILRPTGTLIFEFPDAQKKYIAIMHVEVDEIMSAHGVKIEHYLSVLKFVGGELETIWAYHKEQGMKKMG